MNKNNFQQKQPNNPVAFPETNHSPFTILHSLKRKVAFTLAEVLISIGIIGIVATITMPTVINTVKDRQYKVAREKALSSIGNASKNIAIQGKMNDATNTDAFVRNILSSQLKIVKICDNKHLYNCGISEKIKTFNGEEISMPIYAHKTGQAGKEAGINAVTDGNWDSRGIVTADGFSYNLFYYPKCYGNKLTTEAYFINAVHYACVNAIYDMNGLRGPNQVGKDIGFVTVFYPNETVQAVAPIARELSGSYMNLAQCQEMCAKKNYRMPNVEEGISLSLNSLLLFNRAFLNGSIWTTSTTHAYGSLRYRIVLFYTTTLYQREHYDKADYNLCVE